MREVQKSEGWSRKSTLARRQNRELQKKKMRAPQLIWCWAPQHVNTLILTVLICTITHLHPQHVEGGGGGGNDGGSITWNASAMFVFGDSMEDTGNGLFCSRPRAFKLPFGISFPGYGDGRFSDGRVLISDYLGTTTTTTTTTICMYVCMYVH